MHITRLHAAVSFTVPLTHVLDLAHNNRLSYATEARTFALTKMRERGTAANFCKHCLQANIEWYAIAFDKSVEALREHGACPEPVYEQFVSPCWGNPETLDGIFA